MSAPEKLGGDGGPEGEVRPPGREIEVPRAIPTATTYLWSSRLFDAPSSNSIDGI